MNGHLYYWVADWNLSRAQADRLLGGDSADMVDCTHAALNEVNRTSIERIAGYVTGSPDIRWTAADWATAGIGRAVLRIDQSNQDLPLLADAHYAVDMETGAANPVTAALVAQQRIHAGRDDIIYVDAANLVMMEEHIAMIGLAPGKIIAYQWASPTSNPNTRLPGTPHTLKEANADLSVIIPSFLPLPSHAFASPAHGHSLARARVFPHATGSPPTDIQVDLRTMRWTSDSNSHIQALPWGDR